VTLQRVLEESSPVLVAARLDAEERRTNARLREEQDAAYRAALEADQVCFFVVYGYLYIIFLWSLLHDVFFPVLNLFPCLGFYLGNLGTVVVVY